MNSSRPALCISFEQDPCSYVFDFLMMFRHCLVQVSETSQKKRNGRNPDPFFLRQRPVHTSLVFPARGVESARLVVWSAAEKGHVLPNGKLPEGANVLQKK